MMKHVSWLLILWLGAAAEPTRAQIPPFQWARSAKGPSIDNPVAVDADNNCYVTGRFSSNADFDGTTLASTGGNDMFLIKYSDAGTVLWVLQAGGTSNDSGEGIDTDGFGNVFVTGVFADTARFDSTTVVSAGASMFVAKYDPTGALQWVSVAGGSGSTGGNDIITTADGHSYITGTFTLTADFGDTTLVAGGSSDGFLAKFDPAGQILWVQQFTAVTAVDFARGLDVDVDPDGNCVVSGTYEGGVAIGDSTLSESFSAGAVFLAEFNSSGSFQWAQTVSTSSTFHAPIAVDNQGGTVIATEFWNGPTFSFIMFNAKYDDVGQLAWADSVADFLADFEARDIAVDLDGNSYTIGLFDAAATFGDTSLTASGDDMFIAVRDSDGGFIDVRQAGPSQDQSGHSVALSASGGLYATGLAFWQVDYGDSLLTFPDGFGRFFLVKFASIPTGVSVFADGMPGVTLYQNTPNPFNPSTVIEYELSDERDVRLDVYDVSGRFVRSLVDGRRSARRHSVQWDGKNERGTDVATGVYFYRLQAGTSVSVRKMVLLK